MLPAFIFIVSFLKVLNTKCEFAVSGMKVILLRKGFDSKYGRKPGIIYNNKFISFPIPSNGSRVTYRDLIFDKSAILCRMGLFFFDT